MKHAPTHEALRLLEGRSAILDIAREVSDALRDRNPACAVIGGVAVVLHGHIRTTVDVDVFVTDPESVRVLLESVGFIHGAALREFVKNGIPVHLVTVTQTTNAPRAIEERDGIRVVSLADLISMKLRSGSRDPLRAQDLADVIGLIRANTLDGAFAARIDTDVRPEFRTLVKQVRDRDA